MRTWIVIVLLLSTCSQADAFGRRTRYRSTTRTNNYSAPANYYECNDQGKCEIEAAYMHAHNINGHVFGRIGHFEGWGGDGVNTADISSKLSGQALRALNKSDSALKPRVGPNNFRKVTSRKPLFRKEGGSSRRKRARTQRLGSKKTVQPPLTPHFSGFDFANPTDVDWLNIPREKVRNE